jgi:hypothetical protein
MGMGLGLRINLQNVFIIKCQLGIQVDTSSHLLDMGSESPFFDFLRPPTTTAETTSADLLGLGMIHLIKPSSTSS